jgi:hypothetical protein
MSWIVRIKSVTFPGKHCYLCKTSKGEIRRHMNIASIFNSRASAIMAIELLRRDIKLNVINGAGNLDSRLRFAEVIRHTNRAKESMVYFDQSSRNNA